MVNKAIYPPQENKIKNKQETMKKKRKKKRIITGKDIGTCLNNLLELVLKNPELNEFDTLIKIAGEKWELELTKKF